MRIRKFILAYTALGILVSCAGQTEDEAWIDSVATTEQRATLVSTWTPLANAPPGQLDVCLLLTDATVMCLQQGTNQWHRLNPDDTGSYANGTWNVDANGVSNAIPPMPNGTDASIPACTTSCTYAPLYFSSAVLPDGRVVVIGGEYLGGIAGGVWTNIGFVYNPVSNTWSSQLTTEQFGGIGDSSGIVLADGRFVLADGGLGSSTNMEVLDPSTLTFTTLNPTGKADIHNEENWNILPSGKLLTVDARVVQQSELYDPIANTWGETADTQVNLAGFGIPGVPNTSEIGPCVLRPDSQAICFSGNTLGQNSLYDPDTNSWTNTAAMDFPLVPGQTYAYAQADGVASLLPNGNVLTMASPVAPGSPFNAGAHFYEFDFETNTLVAVTDSPNAASFAAYQGRMLLLPTGEVLLTASDQGAIQDVLLYTNGGAPKDEWRPKITAAPTAVAAGSTYTITGTLFNGFSEGANYGDDAQMSTNYPIVRVTNNTSGNVKFARTHDHSKMGVDEVGSTATTTTFFSVPPDLEPGANTLVVITNGIESEPLTVGQCSAATYPAASMTATTGGPVADGWNLWTNGSLSKSHTFTGGATSITVRARARLAYGVGAHMVVKVGGTTVGQVYVTSLEWADYSFDFNTTAGSKTIQVTFDNDVYSPPTQDRNLYVSTVRVDCGTAPTGSACSSLCENPQQISFNQTYQSGNLGTGAICREVHQPVAGGNCGNFASGRKLSVNGVQMTCNNQNWPVVPPAVNGSYCIQTTPGNYSYAFVTLW